jgi:hypothetical protein
MRLVVTALLVGPALAPLYAEARTQPVRCDTIQRGETVFAVARRVTGRPENLREPWFRIVDGERVIPKAGYNRVKAGWQACIPIDRRLPRAAIPTAAASQARLARGEAGAVSAGVREDTASDARSQSVTASRGAAPLSVAARRSSAAPVGPEPAPAHDWPVTLALMCLGPAAFGAAIGFGWRSVERAVTRRRALSREVRQFADVFVSDFEKPLRIPGDAVRPVRTRSRWVPRDRRLEILLAPAAGRRYPNLDDHRRNLEYDVERIAERLKAYPFDRRPLRAEGEWVVVPFQFNPGPKTGAAL